MISAADPRMQKAQVYTKAELKVFKNEGHGFSQEAGKKAAEAALQWINR